MAPIYLIVAVILVVITCAPFVFRSSRGGIDWALEVAFIRLDFPPEQRVVAQQLAAGLAEIVGMKIKQLTPEHNLIDIAGWAQDGIHAKDLITLFLVAFEVRCDEKTTFRNLVEKVSLKKAESASAAVSAR
jgi:hypothetical protein